MARPISSVEHCTNHLARLRLATVPSTKLDDQDLRAQNVLYLAELQKYPRPVVRDAVDDLVADCEFFPPLKTVRSALANSKRRAEKFCETKALPKQYGYVAPSPVNRAAVERIATEVAAIRADPTTSVLAGALAAWGEQMLERAKERAERWGYTI